MILNLNLTAYTVPPQRNSSCPPSVQAPLGSSCGYVWCTQERADTAQKREKTTILNNKRYPANIPIHIHIGISIFIQNKYNKTRFLFFSYWQVNAKEQQTNIKSKTFEKHLLCPRLLHSTAWVHFKNIIWNKKYNCKKITFSANVNIFLWSTPPNWASTFKYSSSSAWQKWKTMSQCLD